MRCSHLKAILPLLLVCVSFRAQAQVVDQSVCFRVRDPLKVMGLVDVTQSAPTVAPGCRIQRAAVVCTPASAVTRDLEVNGVPFTPSPSSAGTDAVARICYRIKCRRPFPPAQLLQDRFGERTVDDFVPSMLCLPIESGVTTSTTTTTTSSTTTTTMPCAFSGYAAGQLLVAFQADTLAARVFQIALSVGGTIDSLLANLPSGPVFTVVVPTGHELSLIPLFEAYPEVSHAETNNVVVGGFPSPLPECGCCPSGFVCPNLLSCAD